MNTIEQQQQMTVQSAARRDDLVGVGLLMWMANAGEILAPWWSKTRDKQLRDSAKKSDHFQSAMWMIATKITSIPFHVLPRDPSVAAHRKLADEYSVVLADLLQMGQGWEDFWQLFFYDLWTTDNGAFGEVIGGGDPNGELKGPAISLKHLDSWRCTRTSNPVHPVVYQDTDGKRYRFHHTRVIFTSQQKSPAAEMHGVGHCWLTRAVNKTQELVDQSVYKQEKLGSRPLRAMLKGKGITTKQIIGALRQAEESMDNQGLKRFAKMAVLGSQRTDWDIELLDLIGLPDGFDEQTSTQLAMFLIALAGGFPPRWLWPATMAGATKADAMYQHVAGSGGGLTWHLDKMRSLLSVSDHAGAMPAGVVPPRFLPASLKLAFDYQDDEQDRLQAEIRKARAERRKTDLETQVVDVRTAREQATDDGDLTPQQFAALELEDGRLPNGDDVLTLFSSVDDLFVEMLDLGVDDPLAIDLNDPVDMMLEIEEAALNAQDRLVTAGSAREREKAKQAIAALGKLKELYQELVVQQIQQERAAAQPQPPQKPPGEEAPEGEEAPPEEGEQPPEQEEKGFNFGAKVGEVIGGQLARGAGGRFVSASELSAQRSELLGQLLARLRAKRGAGGREGASEAKRAANREKVGDKLGLPSGTLDAMAAMRRGDPVDAAALESLQRQGLAETLPDGTVAMSSGGRSLLNAANAGDVDRAKSAQAKAGEGKGGKKRGGRAARPSAAELEQQERQEAAQNRQRIAEETGVNFDALSAFSEGGPMDEAGARELARAGLVEFDSEGQPRMSSAGKAALRAADKGDAGKVRDTLSRAREKVAKVVERAEKKQDQAAEQRDKLAGIEDEIAEIEALGGLTESARRRLETLQAQADRARERAEQLEADADEILRSVGGAETEEEKAKKKSLGDFGLAVRGAIRGLWSGQTDAFGFVDTMRAAIERRLREAWLAGAAECGIREDELSAAEISALTNAINSQFPHLPGFARDIVVGSKAAGGKLGPLLSRGDTWVNQYEKVFNQAKAMACRDKKLEWRLGEAEHCSSCLKLAGKVKRASWWSENGVLPRVPGAGYLECRGYNCQCSLVPVTFDMSRGPMPSLP